MRSSVDFETIAETVLNMFDRHYSIFLDITRGAKQRFVLQDWEADRVASRQRITLYQKRVDEACDQISEQFDLSNVDKELWRNVKRVYVTLLYEHRQPELAETFYNSVFTRSFAHRYYNNDNLFVRPALSTAYLTGSNPAYKSYYPMKINLTECLQEVLRQCDVGLNFANFDRDVSYLTDQLQYILKTTRKYTDSYQIQVLTPLFYRNKAAYIVGRVLNGAHFHPFVIPLLHDENGEVYADALLSESKDITNLFSFARAYFMADTEVPSAVVNFLHQMLPHKTAADLYTSIGLQKQGKTEFYRDFLAHLRHSTDQLVTSKGTLGMVMTVFTLPSYPFVFKVINDRFAPPKRVTTHLVKEKYQLVKMHDRVGRLADTLEFSHVALPLNRFSEDLLESLKQRIPSSIKIEGDMLIIRHLYIERRLEPLNLYVDEVRGDKLEGAFVEYGNAIKELAEANIFPGDLLLKNFGVTTNCRVIFYDYDEIELMEDCNFRKIPAPENMQQMMASEPWYSVDEKDVFPEEFLLFVSSRVERKELFMKHHKDLLDVDYWRAVQERIRAGVIGDVFPYDKTNRFQNIYDGRILPKK
ncbi:bifunctional isocitrate dehydrogenase kinase/phosphatase [Leucothrix arctica]|uniref:Isocitrate dehydrogenase kinase/phosphatase n=1 Tax=Leucothrix arctica TaxID=1481894 RepID=A0A317C4E1_9GAMM|nr:bifunctional isocitrate dehydrogenase kinase/phosphatase [Leucothrix arctica]PWQ93474.1 bifunctional isocitrate dehydrogenase kinase/phosphatase [Leucothrix arctica]